MEQMAALPRAQERSADVLWGLLRGAPGPRAGPGVRTAGLQHWREAGKESAVAPAGEAGAHRDTQKTPIHLSLASIPCSPVRVCLVFLMVDSVLDAKGRECSLKCIGPMFRSTASAFPWLGWTPAKRGPRSEATWYRWSHPVLALEGHAGVACANGEV